MNEQYFYANDGKRAGPVCFAQLRALATKGGLKRRDKVWCSGMKEWQPAESVPKLFEDLPPDLESEATLEVPPPLPVDEDTDTAPGAETPTAAPRPARSAKQRSPGLMALASLILPGLGQAISGQDAKGLFLVFVSIAANFVTSGLSSLVLCPLMSIDAYTIAKKANTAGVRKWEFFPSVPSINKLAPHVVPSAVIAVVLVFVVIVKLEEKREQDAGLKQNQERFLQILQNAHD